MNFKKYFTFGGVLSSEGVFCRLRINRGMALSKSSDSSLGINSKNLLSGLQMTKITKWFLRWQTPKLLSPTYIMFIKRSRRHVILATNKILTLN